MSLLIPSPDDREDAYAHPELRNQLKEEIKEARETPEGRKQFRWAFEVVPGFFAQSDETTNDHEFDYATANIGRLKSWKQMLSDIEELNKGAKPNEVYKLMACARHGEGWHNVVVAKHGIKAWDKKWGMLYHDGEYEYGPDAMLSDKGILQAKQNNEVWHKEVKDHGAPLPSKFYVSPLRRSMWTLVHTWDGIRPQEQKMIIVESMRERYGLHTCNKRSSKTIIEQRFGEHGIQFEKGFVEEDELHQDDVQETFFAHLLRTNDFLQELFDRDWDHASNAVDRQKALDDMFISTTSHAGTISRMLAVFDHRPFAISTGGMIPVVVKATRDAE